MNQPLSEKPQDRATGPSALERAGARSLCAAVLARWVLAGAIVAAAGVVVAWSYHYSEARRHWQQARIALDQHDPEAARKHLAHCLRRWDADFDVRFAAAQAARLARQLDEAEEHLTVCERPGSDGHLDESVLRERALLQVQQGDFSGYLEKVAPRGSDDPTLSADVLEALAHGYAATFYDNGALACLRRLLEHDPKHGRALLLAGEIQMRATQYEEAAAYLEQAVRCSPHAQLPRRRLAECLLELGKLREAATHLDFVRDRNPDDADILYIQARLLVYTGQLEEAKKGLERILAADPNHAQALLERGQVEYRHGDPRKALAWFELAATLQPGKREVWQGLVHCHEALAQPEQAAKFREAADWLLRELGDMTRLELQHVQQPTGGVDFPLEMARRCERVHLFAKAAAWRIKVLQIDPQHQATHQALADYYDGSGQLHLAKRHRTLATR
jgi:tetratricopeptide (TPR) repeat protein